MKLNLSDSRIAVIGLGYVGLPLLIEFAKNFNCVGFDINKKRISDLEAGVDLTNELTADELATVEVRYTSDISELRDCNVYIVTVPTPIDAQKRPNLTPLEASSATVGSVLSSGDIVIYESTVYPGATEEVCVPILEDKSELIFNQDFYVGYSPERINPGDKIHRIDSIIKVTAGSTPDASIFVDELYKKIVKVGTHRVSSLKVAEAEKLLRTPNGT